MEKYKVFVLTTAEGYITAINSSAFLKNSDGWVLIDEGPGNKYYHAQVYYLPDSVWTDSGVSRYRLVSGNIVECTAAEISAQEKERENFVQNNKTVWDRIAELEAALGMGASVTTIWDELDAAYQEGVDSV